MLALSVLSPPINDGSSLADLERPLKSSANVVATFSERQKTRFCEFYNCEYTFDAFRYALSRERTFDLGQYVLLKNDAYREGSAV